jgi:ABC-type transporter Mla maintaining outer membrane lipid asymmetry ATPase subunit MlaF
MVNSSLMLAQLVVAHDLVQDIVGKTVFLRYLTKELVAKAGEIKDHNIDEMKTLKREIMDALQGVRDNLSVVSDDHTVFSDNM